MQKPMSKMSKMTESSDTNRENTYSSQKSAYSSQENRHYAKPLQIIGLARKAGLLAVGSDSVQTATRAGKAKLIVFASDTSEGSIKRSLYEAEKSKTKSISTPYTKFEFSNIAGKGAPGTLAILDSGLAEEFTKRLEALNYEL